MIYNNDYYVLDFDGQLFLRAYGRDLWLEMPRPEIDGSEIENTPLASIEKKGLAGGGTEHVLRFRASGAELDMLVRCYPQSPFIRVRYCLRGSGGHLTKPSEHDNFRYTAFALPADCVVTEIQLNQYESTRHAYQPSILLRQETGFADIPVCFEGPVITAEFEGLAFLCAYEHGGEYTDNFIGYQILREDTRLLVSLECVEGTYCNNQYFDDGSPYLTPWFHFGLCSGANTNMLPLYRKFILRDMPEFTASRIPYIFYNTWNNQERNRAFRSRRYLQDMNTLQICKEIDIAHRLGVDVFVIDTGWYRSTGDWEVDLERFPDNLKGIRALLDKYGMKLGLWFNPAAAAISSCVGVEHPEFRKQMDGQDVSIGPVWETEESYGMCLVSGYSDWFIDKLVKIGLEYGVKYFKWDAVDMSGCNSPHHGHGGPEATPEQRERNFRFQCGMALTRIAEEVCRRLPGAIVDLDITEGRRYVGLGFLAAGKFFHINNGPYYHDFDIPGAQEAYRENWNVFFYPGAARCRICRQSLCYDNIVPSILFLVHFLPDKPLSSQKEALASLLLGGNGIWGDLQSLDEEDIRLFSTAIEKYKRVAADVTNAYPQRQGFLGSSPEIYEKIDPETTRGIVVFFTREPIKSVYYTQSLAFGGICTVDGADTWHVLPDGRLRMEVELERNESRIVFIYTHDSGVV